MNERGFDKLASRLGAMISEKSAVEKVAKVSKAFR